MDLNECYTGNGTFWMYEDDKYVHIVIDGEIIYVNGQILD